MEHPVVDLEPVLFLEQRAPRCVGAGVDTLYVAWYASIRDDVWDALVEAKARAARAREEGSRNQVTVNAGERGFVIAGHSIENYPFLLTSIGGDFIAAVARPKRGESPAVYVRFSSEFLWREAAKAFEQVERWVERIHAWQPATAEERTTSDPARRALLRARRAPRGIVSRLDLAVDMVGIEPAEMDRAAFTTRARWHGAYYGANARWSLNLHTGEWLQDDDGVFASITKAEREDFVQSPYGVGRSFTGFRFGKSSVVFRVYDKLSEIKQSGKEWFCAIWEASPGGWQGERVWRFEAQLRREVLRELPIVLGTGKCDADPTPAEVLASLTSLWHVVVGAPGSRDGAWITWRTPQPGVPQPCRWPPRSEWEAIRTVSFGESAFPVVRKRRLKGDAIQMARQSYGCMAKWAVCSELRHCGDEEITKRFVAALMAVGSGERLREDLAKKALKLELAREAEVGWVQSRDEAWAGRFVGGG